MSKSVSTLARYRVNLPARYLGLLERTHDPVRIRKTLYGRYTFRGVPGREVDVIIAEAALAHRDDDAVVLEVSDQRPHQLPPALQDVVLEVGEKAGKYDGALRRRYAIRQWPRDRLDEIPWADLRILHEDAEDGQPGALVVIVRPRDGGPTITDQFRVLRGNLEGYDLSRIIGWHWRRYFTHLTDQDRVRAFANAWEAEVTASGEAASWTLAEANRAASRALYRLSREIGWRKLTAEERAALGFPPDAGQWQREAEVAARYSATGCGEATLMAAATGRWRTGEGDESLTEAEVIEMEFDEGG
jgi:hypothetical protein